MKYIGLTVSKYNPHYIPVLVLHASSAIMSHTRLSRNINLFRMLHSIKHIFWVCGPGWYWNYEESTSVKNHKLRIWKISFNFLLVISLLITPYEFLYTKFPLFQHYNATVFIGDVGLSIVSKSPQPPPLTLSFHGGYYTNRHLELDPSVTCMFDGVWFLLPVLKFT